MSASEGGSRLLRVARDSRLSRAASRAVSGVHRCGPAVTPRLSLRATSPFLPVPKSTKPAPSLRAAVFPLKTFEGDPKSAKPWLWFPEAVLSTTRLLWEPTSTTPSEFCSITLCSQRFALEVIM
jgi:hypothetical protein